MLRLFKSKIFLLFLITLILLIFIGLSSNQDSKVNYIGNLISVPLSPFQKFFAIAGEKVEGSLTYLEDIKELKKKNEQLTLQIDQLKKDNRDLDRYSQENEVLRATLKLKDQFKNYNLIGGNIIAKDAGNWFNVFTIDIGTNDGITINSPVITSSGLVGEVIEVSPYTSKVISIIDSNSIVYGINTKTMELVRVKGDIKYKDQGLCIFDYSEGDIEVGDTLETSGLSLKFPKGIEIGKVIEVRGNTSEFDRYAIVAPAVDLKKLQSVFVMKIINNNQAGIGSAKK